MIALRSTVLRARHHALLATVIGLLAFSVIWAHSGVGDQHMGMDMQAAVAVCAAVVETGALVLLASGATGARTESALVIDLHASLPSIDAPATRGVPARASPAVLQVFQR